MVMWSFLGSSVQHGWYCHAHILHSYPMVNVFEGRDIFSLHERGRKQPIRVATTSATLTVQRDDCCSLSDTDPQKHASVAGDVLPTVARVRCFSLVVF